jgi:Lrp/AsnC family leucine-responsive transcriptional regulator
MIDKIDKQILSILQKNSRSSSSDIAKEVKLSTPAVIERIKKMTDVGIIKEFSTVVNSKLLGLDLTAFIFVISDNSSNYKNFINNVEQCAEIYECHSITGSGSHMLKVVVQNSQALENLLYRIQSWPGVSRTQTNLVLSTYKDKKEIQFNI